MRCRGARQATILLQLVFIIFMLMSTSCEKVHKRELSLPKICANVSYLDLMGKLYLGGSVPKNDPTFLNFLAESKLWTTFFFKRGMKWIYIDQLKDKITSLLAQVTYKLPNSDQSLLLILGKSSDREGSSYERKNLSQKRAKHIYDMLMVGLASHPDLKYSKAKIKRGRSLLKVADVKVHGIGDQLTLKASDAIKRNYAWSGDLAYMKRWRESPSLFVNQSTIVINYPCFERLCHHLHSEYQLGCDPDDSKALPRACIKRICK